MSYVLREAEMPILPPGHEDIRVLHFSDLHLTPARKKEIADIKSFISLKPDLVISTGDFLAHKNAVPVALDALDELLDIPGLFVFGSNDYYEPVPKNPLKYLLPNHGKRVHGPELPWQELDAGLQARGWKNLNTSRTTITINDTVIEARGTDDAHLNFDDYSLVAGEAGKCDLAIGITHAPYLRILDAMNKDNLDVIFAGHTHGGQIELPWITTYIMKKVSILGHKKGFYTHEHADVFVTVGTGMVGVPFRFRVPPTIDIIELI